MVRLDLHLHTARHSPCAEALAPDALAPRAAAAGLQGVVLSEHDVLWDQAELAVLQAAQPGLRLYRGLECTVQGAHLLVVGLVHTRGLRRRQPLQEAVAAAHEQGAAVVLAHPYRDGDPEALPLHLVDAVEVASSSFSLEDAARALDLAERLGKPAVAGSDAHAPSVVGWAFTEFPALPRDEAQLAAWIRTGAGSWRRPGAFRT